MELDSQLIQPAESAKTHHFFLNRHFALLWTGQSISEFGSRITREGLPIAAVLVLKATPAQMGLLAALGTLPVLLVGLFAGVWVDRLHRRPILILADLARAILLCSIPLMAVLGMLRIELLYLVTALVGIFTVFFEVASQSFLPTLLQPQDIVTGNSKLETSSALAEIGGPPLAGVLIQAITAPIAILFDAISFLFSALCVGFIRIPEQTPPALEKQSNIWKDIREGWHVMLSNPLLRATAAYAGTRSFFSGAFATLYTLYVIRVLGLSPAVYGLLVMMGGVGGLVGALGAAPIVRRFGLGATLIGMVLLDGVISLGTPLAFGSKLAVISILMAGQLFADLGAVVYSINEVSLRQTIIPNTHLGRVNASMHLLTTGILPIGALIAGMLSEIIGIRFTLLIGASGILLSSAWIVFSPLRRLKGSSPDKEKK